MGQYSLAVSMMKCLAILALIGAALGRPADVAAPVVYAAGLPYPAVAGVYGYGLPVVPYAHVALHSGLVYPVAEAYVHDATGDVADDASPEAAAYAHDDTGETAPEAEAYVHDATGDE